jgi:hypothetical protein
MKEKISLVFEDLNPFDINYKALSNLGSLIFYGN